MKPIPDDLVIMWSLALELERFRSFLDYIDTKFETANIVDRRLCQMHLRDFEEQIRERLARCCDRNGASNYGIQLAAEARAEFPKYLASALEGMAAAGAESSAQTAFAAVEFASAAVLEHWEALTRGEWEARLLWIAKDWGAPAYVPDDATVEFLRLVKPDAEWTENVIKHEFEGVKEWIPKGDLRFIESCIKHCPNRLCQRMLSGLLNHVADMEPEKLSAPAEPLPKQIGGAR